MGDLNFNGLLWISAENPQHQTAGKFANFMNVNKEVFRKYLKMDLHPGSVNVHVKEPEDLQGKLDARTPIPAIVIPRDELKKMAVGLGDGQAWRCTFQCEKILKPIDGWVFRRIGSRIRPGILEFLFTQEIVKPYDLHDNDPVTIFLFEG